MQAAGGLLVAVVVKYADNILKGFAASFAMVITFTVSMYFNGFAPNQNFYFGAVSVCCLAVDDASEAQRWQSITSCLVLSSMTKMWWPPCLL